jgi:mannan endo-1,4-beta-mannosidase
VRFTATRKVAALSAAHGDWRFREGDTQYLGDPPHEPQCWYGHVDRYAGIAQIVC